MTSPGLPTNLDATYADDPAHPDWGDHQRHTDTVHAEVNKHDTAAVPADTTQALFSTGTVYAARKVKSTDVAVFEVNAQTGTSYTLVLADAGKMVTLNNGSAITLTIPTNASVAFPVNTVIQFAQLGAGQVTLAVAGGVTCSSRGITPPIKTAGQYSRGALWQISANTWVADGDVSA